MSEQGRSNRRAHDRIRKHFTSSVRTLTGDKAGAWMLVFVRNVSAGGVLYNAEFPVRVGEPLELRIDMLSGRDPISCTGRVVRCRPIEGYPLFETAVQFHRIEESDKAYLDRLAQLLKESADRKERP